MEKAQLSKSLPSWRVRYRGRRRFCFDSLGSSAIDRGPFGSLRGGCQLYVMDSSLTFALSKILFSL